MIEEIKNIRGSRSEYRKFGLTIGIALIVLAGVLFILRKPACFNSLIAGTAFSLTAISWAMLLKPVYYVWMSISIVLGWVMTRVILTILFYFVLTPIAVVARIVGKDFIGRRWDRNQTSYWNERDTETDPRHYERQF